MSAEHVASRAGRLDLSPEDLRRRFRARALVFHTIDGVGLGQDATRDLRLGGERAARCAAQTGGKPRVRT